MQEINNEEWLVSKSGLYGLLREDEKQILKDFVIVWAHTEHQCFNNNANQVQIKNFVEQKHVSMTISSQRVSRLGCVSEPFGYFFERYFRISDAQGYLESLCPNRQSLRIKQRLAEIAKYNSCSDFQKLEFVLLVAYRLRNNFFHGEKTRYGYQDQFDNFYFAIESLKLACEI